MKERIPLVLSATAFVVALFGATPLGEAARDKIPPLAKHAKTADLAKKAKRANYATNAGAVGRVKVSRKPRAGFLVPLAKNGKLPASVLPSTAGGK